MELIDRKQLQIETQSLEDVGQSEMQFYSVEQVDNAPTIKAVPLEVVEQIKKEIEQLHDANSEDTDFCDGLIRALIIIDEHMKEVEQ